MAITPKWTMVSDGCWQDSSSANPIYHIINTAAPDGAADPQASATKGSWYIRPGTTDDYSQWYQKVADNDADADWQKVLVNYNEEAVVLEGSLTMGTTARFQVRDSTLYVYSPSASTGAIALGASGDVWQIGDQAASNYWEFQFDGTLVPTGASRLNFSSVNIAAANTDGGLIKGGTEATKIVEDTADMKFISFYFDNGATSGDNRGIYNRLYLSGAGGGGESFRTMTSIDDVAAGTAHGAHLTLNFEATGSCTGLGVASRNTLHIPNAAMTGGTYASTMAEIFSDGTSSDPAAVTELSFLRFVNDGHSNGITDVDDKAFLFTLAGGTLGSGNVMAAKTASAVSHGLRVKIHGITYYVMLSDAQ